MDIRINRVLDASKVREVCIKNDLYNQGCNEEYAKMLDAVSDMPGYIEDLDDIIITTAKDIAEHTQDRQDQDGLVSIVYLLATQAVRTIVDLDYDD